MNDSGSISSHRVTHSVGRFAALLAADTCPRLPCDQVILEENGCVVTPTLGSILPYWLLLVPRLPTLSFRDWRQATAFEPDRLVDNVLRKLNVNPHRAYWFEHGSANYHSVVGCGVDQAHIHILIDAPFSFDAFISSARDLSEKSWSKVCSGEVYRSVPTGQSYLIAASQSETMLAVSVESVGSQFFRRVIANLSEQPTAWNYKTHPHEENIEKTLAAFKFSSEHALR